MLKEQVTCGISRIHTLRNWSAPFWSKSSACFLSNFVVHAQVSYSQWVVSSGKSSLVDSWKLEINSWNVPCTNHTASSFVPFQARFSDMNWHAWIMNLNLEGNKYCHVASIPSDWSKRFTYITWVGHIAVRTQQHLLGTCHIRKISSKAWQNVLRHCETRKSVWL